MSLAQHQRDHEYCLGIAAEMLKAPARPLSLGWDAMAAILPKLCLVERRGLGRTPAMFNFSAGRHGHDFFFGAEMFRVQQQERPLHVVQIAAPHADYASWWMYRFWAVAAADFRRFYRAVRREIRRKQRHPPPLMRDADRARLWENTIGFLRHDCGRLLKYGITPKRGVLLLGEPGNGKTMACRWLRAECNRAGLNWRSVSAEELQSSLQSSEAHDLFQLDRPGIIFFDDVDSALRKRTSETSTLQSTFLGGLDGMDPHHGVVYVFTTNAKLDELDPAFRRPGRIDYALSFAKPDGDLRRELIVRNWHAEIIEQISLETAVADSAGFSFAEMEELKKLFVLRFLNDGEWNWEAAKSAFQLDRRVENAKPTIGFMPIADKPTEQTLSAASRV